MNAAIRFENVTVRVGRTEILKDLSVSFPKGRISVLLGPNGCGKTTLLQCLNGMSEIAGGHVFLGETDLSSLSGKGKYKVGPERFVRFPDRPRCFFRKDHLPSFRIARLTLSSDVQVFLLRSFVLFPDFR